MQNDFDKDETIRQADIADREEENAVAEIPASDSSPENTEEETKEEKEKREERERVSKMNPLNRMKYNLEKLQDQRKHFIEQKIKFQALATGYEGHVKNIDTLIKQAKAVVKHLESTRKNG